MNYALKKLIRIYILKYEALVVEVLASFPLFLLEEEI